MGSVLFIHNLVHGGGLSPPFDHQVTLTVSAFCSEFDTESKKKTKVKLWLEGQLSLLFVQNLIPSPKNLRSNFAQ